MNNLNKNIKSQIKQLKGFLALMSAFLNYAKNSDELDKNNGFLVSDINRANMLLTDKLNDIIKEFEAIKRLYL